MLMVKRGHYWAIVGSFQCLCNFHVRFLPAFAVDQGAQTTSFGHAPDDQIHHTLDTELAAMVRWAANDARSRSRIFEAGCLGSDLCKSVRRKTYLCLGYAGQEIPKLAKELEADLIVVSPGVPLNIRPLEEARAAGVAITNEVDIFA